MRKYILLLIALCVQIAARGQTGWHYEYWFDDDRNNAQRKSSNADSLHIDADISGLSESLHAFHIQVVNDTLPSIPITRYFIKTPNQKDGYRYWFDGNTDKVYATTSVSNAVSIDVSMLSDGFHTLYLQSQGKNGTVSSTASHMFFKVYMPGNAYGRYWFDEQIDKLYTSPNLQGLMDIDVSHLDEGLHTINYQVVGAGGSVSSTATRSFYKVYISNGISWRCWFDNDFSTLQEGDGVDDTLLLDVTDLADGYHMLHIQADGGSGYASVPLSKHFIKIPQTINAGDFTCLFLVDGQLAQQEQVPANGGFIEWNLDVSELSQGFHSYYVQIVTPSGAASNTWQGFFLREATRSELGELKCVYAIDGAEFYTEAGTVADGTFHFDLDVSSLDDGLHRIAYMLSNGKGVTTKSQMQFFVKTPLGGNGVTEYWYWLNDQGDQQAKKVTLPERKDPFSLITLLPVAQEPIRSKLFQFRIENGNPIVYAKNDIHVRFYDAAGRFTDVSKQYVDEREKMNVEPVGELQSTQTFPRVAETDIRWYRVVCERGDSIALQCSQATNIQAFAPSSTEVFNVNGSESVKFDGFHAEEDGTYYIAIHDVKGLAQTMSLNYQHIDKFDLRNTSKPEFGVLPCVQILELDGNGFDNLKSAIFRNEYKEIIADSIACYSKSNAKLYFLMNGDEPYGKYDLILNFDDGDDKRSITKEKFVTFMEASFDNIEIVISDPRTVADPYPVHITVTNRSNICYQAIPFYFAIDNIDQISSVKYMNFSVTCSRELYENGLKLSFEYDNFENNQSKTRVVPTIIPELLPGESKTYTLGVKTGNHRLFNVYAWTGRPWNLLAPETKDFIKNKFSHIATTKAMRRADGIAGIFDGCQDDPCDIAGVGGDLAECACGTALGLGGTLGGIQNALQNQHNRAMRDQLAQSGLFDDPGEYFPDQNLPSPEDLLLYWLQHCLSGKAEEAVSGYNSAREMMGDDPCQDPPPHSCNPYNPGDPNDIFGYMAESGSRFKRKDVTDGFYTIEFENDPEIANAAAHTIVVRDTLDGTRFDLSTFEPTSIKIGNVITEVNASTQFPITIDLRPRIDVIAQVSLTYDESTGIAVWMIESLDPMTMEPTQDAMQGVLPVNVDGNGQGELSFNIDFKEGLADGIQIHNRAGIVFDHEECILTPIWTNTIDATVPESHVANVQMKNDSTATVSIVANDELSGPWRYDVYVQYGENAPWWKMAENVPADTTASVKVYEGVDHGFYVVLTDSAGNVEQKNAEREYSFEVFAPQIETNTKLQLAQGWNWISHNQQEVLSAAPLKSKAKRIVSQTDELFKDEKIGWMGSLNELLPTELYKVQMNEEDEIQLSGKLFNAEFRSIPLYEGWNWISYPVANVMTPDEALMKLEAEEGDFIIGQDGMATFTNGEWAGTLPIMKPGIGYMYRSQSNKNLFFNATAQSSTRQFKVQRSITYGQWPENWNFDKRKYPNVMGVVADLYQNESPMDANEWIVAAFCGEECRGMSQSVNGHIMMNVYGTGGELITFLALNSESGEVVVMNESEPFRVDILGTMRQPYELHFGTATGIAELKNGRWKIDNAIIFDLQGRRVDKSTTTTKDGIYIVSDGAKSQKHVIRKSK